MRLRAHVTTGRRSRHPEVRRAALALAVATATTGLLVTGLASPATAATIGESGVRATSSATAVTADGSRASRTATRAALMRASAVRIGKAKVGRAQYVAGGSGPNSFDCSGFTSWVWRQVGRSIPHSSYAQYSGLKRITRSQARPGDLVFFFRGGVHHVGLYIGSGRMVHAANPRRDILISAIDGYWYAEHYSGFRRVV